MRIVFKGGKLMVEKSSGEIIGQWTIAILNSKGIKIHGPESSFDILLLCFSGYVPRLGCLISEHFSFTCLIYFFTIVKFVKLTSYTFQLWVGRGSKAAEEKQFFDSHLAPFYRIEQVLTLFHFFCVLQK